MWGFFSQYLKVLEECGYEELPDKYPHVAISHIRNSIQPKELKERMNEITHVRKAEKFHEKCLNAFMIELAKQGKLMDDYRHRRGKTSDNGPSGKPSKDQNNTPYGKKKGFKNGNLPPAKQIFKKGNCDKPRCLNPKCLEFHYMNECSNTSEEDKARFIRKWREEKEKKKDSGHVGRLSADEIDSHSSLFTSTLVDGAVECVALADQGSDVNLMPQKVFQAYCSSVKDSKVVDLADPRTYNGVGGGRISYNKKVTADITLRIGHASKLLLRNVEWYVSDEESEKILLSILLLEALGLNNKTLLKAACDRYNVVFDMTENMVEDEVPPCPSISAVREEGVFHISGSPYETENEEGDMYIDLGEDTEEELTQELEKRIEEA